MHNAGVDSYWTMAITGSRYRQDGLSGCLLFSDVAVNKGSEL
jgi:hypothetical protein